jgi:hypothetical protein
LILFPEISSGGGDERWQGAVCAVDGFSPLEFVYPQRGALRRRPPGAQFHLRIDDLGMRKLPVTAAEELLEIIMRRYERASSLITSNRPVEDWGKLLGDSAAVSAMLDRLLHHGHVLRCGPRSWRTKVGGTGDPQ